MPERTPNTDAAALLPAWFVERMMSDVWSFGLLLSTGIVLYVESISAVQEASDGSLWLDVRLGDGFSSDNVWGLSLAKSPTSRSEASVNAAHVVAAFELADT